LGASNGKSYTVGHQCGGVRSRPPALANWTAGLVGYSQTISASGGTGGLSFSAPAASLPTGLTLSTAGVLSGTPTATGSYSFTVTATDALGASNGKSYTVVINAAVSITTPAWPMDGGPGPATARRSVPRVVRGECRLALPRSPATGLTLSTAGVLSGTPTATGSYNLHGDRDRRAGCQQWQELHGGHHPAVSITTASLANWTAGLVGYSQTISATGGTGGVSFSAPAASLPTGLTLSTAACSQGHRRQRGSSTFTVTATDALGASKWQELHGGHQSGGVDHRRPAWPTGQRACRLQPDDQRHGWYGGSVV